MEVVRVCRICKVKEIPFDSESDLCPECYRKERKKYGILVIVCWILIAIFSVLIISPIDLFSFSPVDDILMIIPLALSMVGEIYSSVQKGKIRNPADDTF
ncbi:MAG: hypothetical protein J5825_00795 [Lachnospiraceae bacterium]|nr:hypothetical protein [Lachnospiraceae bacterium]